MNLLRNYWKLGTVAPAALLVLTASAASADLLADEVLIGTSGDGLIFSDPSEGVFEPGVKAVTFTRTRVPDGSGGNDFVDPFEEIVTDFSSLTSRGNVTNCIMANNPDVYCDSESGSGKRVKTYLTGPEAFDLRMRTVSSATHPSVDYFSFGKASNFTGARMTGLSLQLLDADGNLMGTLAPEDAALFNLSATDIGIGARLPDGLFGSGGHEGNIGFFSTDRAPLTRTTSTDTLTFGALTNAEYVANFGNGMLDNSMTPDGLFWDDNNDPTDESSLIAWNNLSNGGWTYGTLETATDIDARLAELATALGVDVADLGYVDGGLVPDEIVAAANANGLFAVDAVEDLRNANLNYTITVGDVDAGEFTVRLAPSFAPIVSSATSLHEFKLAGQLDAAANVPYYDLGNAAAYQTAITDLMAMDTAARSAALTSTGYSFAPAFSSLGFEMSRGQVDTVFSIPSQSAAGGEGVSRNHNMDTWRMGEGWTGLMSVNGSQTTYDATATSVGYDIDIASLSFGVEKTVNPNASWGVMLGVMDASSDAQNGLGDVDSSGVSITAFGRLSFGDGGLVRAAFGYQDTSYDSTRNVLGQQAIGSTDGSQTFAALQAEYMQSLGALRWGPTASLEYYDVSVDGFTETGAGIWNLTVGGLSSEMVLASVGLRGEYELPGQGGGTLLTGGLEYTAASGDDFAVQSGFVGLPGSVLNVQGLDDSWVDINLGFETQLASGAAGGSVLYGGYAGSIGSDYESHRFQVGFNYLF
ncbi:choice-of-anchor F family protein [Pseudophaeobacter sp.]|uniref:choice-of-anchor F family protein n=1 Tax=Pseudophaeobacter sp. TaxID=1971739 RepID=UPI003297208C